MLRAILGCTLVLTFSGLLTAEDKKADAIDAKKLVGKWTSKNEKERDFTIEFKKDGKAVIDVIPLKKAFEATYKVEGNKLILSMKFGDKEETKTRTISKLTDTELVSKDEKGKEETLERIKDK